MVSPGAGGRHLSLGQPEWQRLAGLAFLMRSSPLDRPAHAVLRPGEEAGPPIPPPSMPEARAVRKVGHREASIAHIAIRCTTALERLMAQKGALS